MSIPAPLYTEIARTLEDQIIQGALPEGQQVPSTNELAAFYRINPATASKGVGLLVDQGVLYKQRGVGMFVAAGAREALLQARRQRFVHDHLTPLLVESSLLGISDSEVIDMIRTKRVSV